MPLREALGALEVETSAKGMALNMKDIFPRHQRLVQRFLHEALEGVEFSKRSDSDMLTDWPVETVEARDLLKI